MKQYEINIRKGDKVTVVGSRIMFEGKTALIAKSVAIGNETYNFRDPVREPSLVIDCCCCFLGEEIA